MSWKVLVSALAAMVAAPAVAAAAQEKPMAQTIERKTCTAPDGVTIVYSAAGAGEPALVFIHGGLGTTRCSSAPPSSTGS